MSSQNIVLVTGASGFIGGRLVEILLAHGVRIRVATSNPSRLAGRWDPAVELICADLNDKAALSRACEGCDTVFHVAYQFGGSTQKQRSANIDGTRALAESALLHKVRVFVHFSSVAAYGAPRDGDLDESATPEPSSDVYCGIKQDIDRMLLSLHASRGLPVVILQPTIVYGPRGGIWTTSLLEQVKSRHVALPRSGLGLCNAVYVDDVVTAAILTRGHDAAIGQKFLISGAEPVTWHAFYRAFAAMVGKEAITVLDDTQFDLDYQRRYGRVRALQRYRRAFERISSRLTNRADTSVYLPDPGTRSLYAAQTHVRIDKARALMGYAPSFDLDRGMAETAAWANRAKLI